MRILRNGLPTDDPQFGIIRRQRTIIVVAVACAVLSTTGLVLSRVIKSPRQVAAEASPPEASLITAPVTEQILATSLIFRATVSTADRIDITPTVSTATDAKSAMVSGLAVAAGDTVTEGQVLLQVSGRPLYVLAGLVPAYRDLRPGSSGPDVKQLQVALQSLGYLSDTADGVFGARTKDAVARFYESIGYAVPDTGGPGGDGDRQALRAANDEVAAAQQAVNDKKSQIADVLARPTPGPSGPITASPDMTQLQQQLSDLEVKFRRVVSDQEYLIAHTGAMVPAAEVAFVPSFPARVASLTAKVGSPVTAPLVTISTGGLVVTTKMEPNKAALLRVGVTAQLNAEVLAASADATVSTIGVPMSEAPSGQAAGGASSGPGGMVPAGTPYVLVTITPSQTLPDIWNGQDVRVTFSLAQTQGAVLAVPIAAITTRADGQTVVNVVGADGTIRLVAVRPGVSANGLVQVTPSDGSLKAGDRVSVGLAGGVT